MWPVSVRTALNRGWDNSIGSDYATGWTTTELWFDSRQEQECSFTIQNAQPGFGIHTTFCAVGIGEGLFPGKTAGLWEPTLRELHLLPETRSIVPVYWHFTSLHDTWERLSGLPQLLMLWLFHANTDAPGLNPLGTHVQYQHPHDVTGVQSC